VAPPTAPACTASLVSASVAVCRADSSCCSLIGIGPSVRKPLELVDAAAGLLDEQGPLVAELAPHEPDHERVQAERPEQRGPGREERWPATPLEEPDHGRERRGQDHGDQQRDDEQFEPHHREDDARSERQQDEDLQGARRGAAEPVAPQARHGSGLVRSVHGATLARVVAPRPTAPPRREVRPVCRSSRA
jgi:antitoxin (DNA-binding transcriptional repressor) of toxin-antitoxin stability system